MIAVDTNILVYAHRRDCPWNAAAYACIRELCAQRAQWAIAWPCLYEFFAIVTHPRIYAPPSSAEQALTQIDAWLKAPNLVLLSEEPSHCSRLQEQLVQGQVTGALVHDAKIATLCLVHGVSELWTADRDFSRFPRLISHNPLMQSAK